MLQNAAIKRPGRVLRLLVAALLAASILAVGAVNRPAKAFWHEFGCWGDVSVKVLNDPWLSVSFWGISRPASTGAAVCFWTGSAAPNLAGGTAGVGTCTFLDEYCYGDARVSLWSLNDPGTTLWPWQSSGTSVNHSGPFITPIGNAANGDLLFAAGYGFTVCAAGCTGVGDNLAQTGAVVGIISVGPAPGGGQGGSATLQRTEIWFDGQLVQSFSGTQVAGLGISNTSAPTVNNTLTPASSPCVLVVVCVGAPTGTLSVNGYSETATLVIAGTSVPVTVSTAPATTGGNKTCIYANPGPGC